jgi:density-regulated protein
VKKCQEWLEKNHPEMYEKLYSEGAIPPGSHALCFCFCFCFFGILGFPMPPDICRSDSSNMPQEAIAASLSALSVDAQKRAAKDSAKKAAKADAASARAAEERAAARVLIKRVERNKRKFVTAVSGLEAFGLDIKKVSKDFGKKFATGSSVTKTASGGEEIVVQGDLSDEIYEYLVDEGEIPDDNVELVEDKKKRPG